jgi:hypothetical protein
MMEISRWLSGCTPTKQRSSCRYRTQYVHSFYPRWALCATFARVVVGGVLLSFLVDGLVVGAGGCVHVCVRPAHAWDAYRSGAGWFLNGW